jgi:outer membrane protein OmpA-like peptidoglycan-associated protein
LKTAVLIAAFCIIAGVTPAQTSNVPRILSFDETAPRFSLEARFETPLLFSEKCSNLDISGFKSPAPGNISIPIPSYTHSSSATWALGFSYYKGKKRRLGWGIELARSQNDGTLSLNNFNIAYQGTDSRGHIFRQMIASASATGSTAITEHVSLTGYNLPILIKYKQQFSNDFGVVAEGGLVLNLYSRQQYATDALFNYEAAYSTGKDGAYIYDSAMYPGASDWLITKANFLAHNKGGNADQYFAQKYAAGYNVALLAAPATTSGTMDKWFPQLGWVLKLSGFYQMNFRSSLLVGLTCNYREMRQTNTASWMLTNHVGEYSSMLNGLPKITETSIGIQVGVRYAMGGDRDQDRDGVADYKDRCPTVPGMKQYFGCPDTDGDGLPDNADSCPLEWGPECTDGCPDRDGDCVADKYDDCPDEAGLKSLHGCLDRKDYRILPKSDGVSNASEPVVTDVIVTLPPSLTLSTQTVFFDFENERVNRESETVLKSILEVLRNNENILLHISGYADNINIGKALLSFDRAKMLRNYLLRRGAKKERVFVDSHGETQNLQESDPNRGVIFELLLPSVQK